MRITTQQQITIQPQLADLLSKLEVGDTVRGKIMEVFGESISLKTASGHMLTAALMEAGELKPGQTIELSIKSITDDGIFAELKSQQTKQTAEENPKLQQLLKQMDLKPEPNNVQAAKLLMKYSMPVNKENIVNLVNSQKGVEALAQGDPTKAVALMQSELPINNTEITKLVKQTVLLENQSQQALKNLSQTMTGEAKPALKAANTERIQQEQGSVNEAKQIEPAKTAETAAKPVMQQLAAQIDTETAGSAAPKLEKLIDTITKVFDAAAQAKPEHLAYLKSKNIEATPSALKALVDNAENRNKLSKQLEGFDKLLEVLERNEVDTKEMKQEIKKLYLKPESFHDKDKVTENMKDIAKLGNKLEAALKEHGFENKVDTSIIQDAKNNLELVKNINATVNYLQIPIMVNENKTTADIYVFNNKKSSKSVNPDNATILIALDLQSLGHIESLIAVTKKSIHLTFKVEKDEFKKVISAHSETLKLALEARGYKLDALNLIDIKEKFSLLELEELNKVEAGQFHMDIRV